MKYVYILQSVVDPEHFYVGITDDLRARLRKHNAGEVSHTSKYKPWRLKTYIAFANENRPSHLKNISSQLPDAHLQRRGCDATGTSGRIDSWSRAVAK